MVDNLNKLIDEVEEEIKPEFKKINKICEENSRKVLTSFQRNHISEMHFNSTSGYGYGDVGRDAIEKIFAEVLGAEDALVRSQFISGTHALTVCLFGLLRPGDTVLSINGKPYDTLDSVIGICENNSSLKSYGVKYEQIELIGNEFDYEGIRKRVSRNDIKLVIMQRSRGYAIRKSLELQNIKKVVEEIRKENKDVIIMCDNCYGEFVDTEEPLNYGVDVIVRITYKKFRRRIGTKRRIYCWKKRTCGIMCRKINSPRSWKRSRAKPWYK